MIDLELITDFFLFLLIGSVVTFFQMLVLKREFPGKIIPPLVVAQVGSFGGSLIGSFILSYFAINSIWILAGSALFLSYLFLQVFYKLSQTRDYY